jgi:DNA-binding beta-propeller fold protein YncE
MLRTVSSLGLILALAACGGGGSSSRPSGPPPMFAISGSVSGLQGPDLVLRFNSTIDTVLHANGNFTGPLFPRGTAYSVVVQDQPRNPWQTCTVTNGSGTLTAPVSNVAVRCVTNTYRVSGTVAGLAGTNFAVIFNGTSVPITQNGTFTLPGDVASGLNYIVTVATQPVEPQQDCVLANYLGTMQGADITNVTVTCTTRPLSYHVLRLPAPSLAYNPTSGELYVSVVTPTGGAILVIDPRTGTTLRSVPTPFAPSLLAISDDAQFLYADMGLTGTIRRYALPALTTNLEFPIGVDQTGYPLEVHDMRVAPGNAGTVAITRLNKRPSPWGYELAIFDDGVKRADTVGDLIPVSGTPAPDGAVWNEDGTKIYSHSPILIAPQFYESAVSASGVTLAHTIPLPPERSYGADVFDSRVARNHQMVGKRLYTASGAVFDPARRTQVGAFRTEGGGFAVDTALNKAFFPSGGIFTPLAFESFDLARMTPLDKREIPDVFGNVWKMVRWGPDGLAAIVGDWVVIVWGGLVSDPTLGIPLPPGNLVESTGNAGAYQYRVYDLPANDVLWDAGRERLYAAVNGTHRAFGNSIAAINVNLNVVVGGVPTGSEPTRMSASDDGTRLYVTHYASSSVSRIDLTTMALNTVFLMNFPGQGPGYALAAEPRPGDASTFAYIEHYPGVSTVFTRMISNFTLQPLSFDEPISTMAFVNADTLFANNTGSSSLDFYEIGVVPAGLQLVRNDQNLFNTLTRMTFAGGLLYADAGYSIDPTTRTVAHTYNPGMGGAPKAFRANPARDRAYLAFEDSGSVAQLLVFRLSDATLLATVPLPANLESPISLASMGANGVAITTTAGKTVIVQGPDL